MYLTSRDELKKEFIVIQNILGKEIENKDELELATMAVLQKIEFLTEGEVSERIEKALLYYPLINFNKSIQDKTYYPLLVNVMNKKKKRETLIPDIVSSINTTEYVLSCCSREKGFQETTCICGDISNCSK